MEQFSWCHHLDSKLARACEVSSVENGESARLRRDCRLQHVSIVWIIGVSPPQVVDLVALGFSEK
ncbi:hypothetical protein [Salinibacter ruber]|uniref:Uncharacterized protein n=1 Tax=Salinibacter ruber TaxID=146919 RepID=A0A9X2U5A5_9BACT|nr:hypothetical protein [Salinibacter ruber]MCS3860155.1 hypothetical protein [Salinibacter ruber]MCS3866987.1 hypothetical protein [Salinibacter ruber]MCS4178350.1 hypothetical protein [Salinibacter ruber]